MTSLPESSPSRNSSWAITTLATLSSISVPRNTMRSLSSREYRSQPRSPRWVCSITVGIRLTGCDRLLSPRYFLISLAISPRLRAGEPGDERGAREPPAGAELAAGQLAGLGELDHRRLGDLEELAGLLGVQHLGR